MTDATSRRATRARHDALVELLRDGVDGVEALAGRVGVSPSTVRRDLARLQREGRIARTYGGALVRDTFTERSFGESARIHQEAKAAIAEAALPTRPRGWHRVPRRRHHLPGAGPAAGRARAPDRGHPGPGGGAAAGALRRRPRRRARRRGAPAQPRRGRRALVALARTAGLRRRLPRCRRRRPRARHRGADAGGDPRQGGRCLPGEQRRGARRLLQAAPATLPAWLPLEPTWTLVTGPRPTPLPSRASRVGSW